MFSYAAVGIGSAIAGMQFGTIAFVNKERARTYVWGVLGSDMEADWGRTGRQIWFVLRSGL